MDLLIPDNWLREFLNTNATNKEMAKYLSLCGPSIEKTLKSEIGDVYSIEVTTNRMDSASVYGIAREASAILPRFGIKAKLQPLNPKSNYKFVKKVTYLSPVIDSELCPRFATALIRNVAIGGSPKLIQDRLTTSGVRPINNIVDISNYIMLELGQPVHTFDYDKISKSKMLLRKSIKGEKVTTLDDQACLLSDEDIVIEDGSGKLIDLCGIMGGSLSAIDANTKNVLLFVQTYNPVNIRKTSMRLAKRTGAAALFEKGIDSEQVRNAILTALDMFVKLTKGVPEKEILDIYPNPYKERKIKVTHTEITAKLGLEISKKEISEILTSLQFDPVWNGESMTCKIPSFRSDDIKIPEDISEEIARIHGYHTFPSKIMSGVIPEQPNETPFIFEDKIKNILKGYGGAEVYTLSLVSRKNAEDSALKLTNPLANDTEYLRTSLRNSLIEAAKVNSGEKNPFHLFEVANVYIPRNNNLPEEKIHLAGIFVNTNYREAKGIIQALLDELNVPCQFVQEELEHFAAGQRVTIKSDKEVIGQLGILEIDGLTYYDFDLEKLRKVSSQWNKYRPIPQSPPQIEDITINFPEKTKTGDVITLIKEVSDLISQVELTTIYNNAYTFKIWYQDQNKTLTNKDVDLVRNKIIQSIKVKFGGVVKE